MRERELTVAQQFLLLSSNPLCSGSGELKRERLTWCFSIRPSPLSRCYDVRIEYRSGRPPDIFIDSPDLHRLAGGRELPHVYSDFPPKLCLYLPGAFEWSRRHRLDLTILPWTALWLFYFEEWLWSEEWKGGGMHVRDLDAIRIARREGLQ